VGKKTPKTAPSLWDCVTPPEDRATATSNMHKNLVKITCSSGDMLADRQTDRHTHTDVLITILRHRSRGRSNNKLNKAVSYW